MNKRDELEHARKSSGSSVGIHCNEGGCVATLTLTRTTSAQPTHEDDYQKLMPALDKAAVFLDWRLYQSVWWCPTHVFSKNLECVRCRAACPACSCMDGPRIDAVAGKAHRT